MSIQTNEIKPRLDTTHPTMIDLFAGCGGVTQGFKNRHFRILAAVEFDGPAAETYRRNHPEVCLYEEDIRRISPQKVMEQCNINEGELTVLSTCAPCQPFSPQNKSKKKDFRTSLVLQMIRFVKVLRPQFIFMENVPGLVKGSNKTILDALVKALGDGLGYMLVEPDIVDAVDYGVPQHRERLILLGSRDKISLSILESTHASPKKARLQGRQEWTTVQDAFQGITRLATGQKSRTDPLHKARKHTPLNIERLKHIPKNGGSRKSLPDHLQLACHKNKSGYNDVYGRMDFRKPSNTLTTGCTNFTKGRFAHPTANRAITPREAARLQTFPDNYEFVGSYDQVSTQIGNAVPVLLAEVFAGYLRNLWENVAA